MSVASFVNPPLDPEGLMIWSFSHQAHHRDISRRIVELGGKQIPDYALDPFDPLNIGIWTDQHQDLHNQMNKALYGVAGYDLTQVDWTDDSSLSTWLALNYTEHARAAASLGVG